MFKKFSYGMKCGILMMLFAGILMLLMVILEKPVFDVIVWLFLSGMVITIVSSILFRRRDKGVLEKKG